MIAYFDSSALVKRYLDEPGSDLVRGLLHDADRVLLSRVGAIETVRAIGLANNPREVERFRSNRETFDLIELSDAIEERAGTLAIKHNLRSLDAIHLASAEALASDELIFVCWDRHLRAAATDEGLEVAPIDLD